MKYILSIESEILGKKNCKAFVREFEINVWVIDFWNSIASPDDCVIYEQKKTNRKRKKNYFIIIAF